MDHDARRPLVENLLDYVDEDAERAPGYEAPKRIAAVQQREQGRGIRDHPVLGREQHRYLVGARTRLDRLAQLG